MTTITNIIAFVLLETSWKTVADRTTTLVKRIQQKCNRIYSNFFAFSIIFIIVLLLFVILRYPINIKYIAIVIVILHC